MGGISVFKWENDELIILHNRENWEARLTKAAAWDKEKKILAGRCGVLEHGSWFAVSKNGRVALLVDSSLHEDGFGVNEISDTNAAIITMGFMDDTSSPTQIVDFVAHGLLADGTPIGEAPYPDARDLTYTYNLILADIKSRKMFHLSKPVASNRHVSAQEVPFGVHTMSIYGLDHQAPKDRRLRSLFDENVGSFDRNTMPSLKILSNTVMLDRLPTFGQDPMSAIYAEKTACHTVSVGLGIQRFGTSTTTAFSARAIKEIKEDTTEIPSTSTSSASPLMECMFYELNRNGSPREFTFDIEL